ncbi:MAG: hypothetical protein KKE53_11025 [Proteobacteria bacterium]|nr:hypothetical protein [Pseudomonadota bacterium]
MALGVAFGKSSLYIFFYHYFPFFNYPRVSNRIMVMVLFAGAIAVAFFVKSLEDRCKKRGAHVLVILLFVVAMGVQLKDYNVFRPIGITLLDKGQDIYTYVQENIGDGLLLEVPLWPGDSHQSSLYQHYIMLDRVKRVNGYSPLVLNEYLKTVIAPLSDINAGILNRQQYELLREMNVKFLTVHQHENVFPPKVTAYGPLTTVRRLIQSPYLELVDIDNFMHFKTFDWRNEDIYLFKVKENIPAAEDENSNYWYEMPYFYDVNSHMYQQTGEIVADKEIGKKVFQASEGKNKAGFVVYGPYDVYSPGEYRCYFTINTEADTEADTEGNIARIEVARVTESDAQVVLAQREVKGLVRNKRYRKLYLDFSLAQKEKLEFRVFYYGKGQVRIKNIAVYKAGSETPLSFLEAEKMVGATGQLVFVKDASGGKVIEAIAKKSPKGDLVYGPNRIYNKGRYTSRFYLRMKDATHLNPSDVVAIVSVTDGQNLRRLGKRNVTVGELNENSFTGIETDFALKYDEELSFHVRFTDKVSLQLDGIEIVKN